MKLLHIEQDTKQYIQSYHDIMSEIIGLRQTMCLPRHFLRCYRIYLVIGETADQKPHVDEEGEHMVAHVSCGGEQSQKHR